MHSRPPRNTVPPAPPEIGAHEFGELREFFRGYLHQDWEQEHGSLAQAVRQFCRDADKDEQAKVAAQWNRFLELTRPQPLPVIVRLLTSALGSGWMPDDPSQLLVIGQILDSR